MGIETHLRAWPCFPIGHSHLGQGVCDNRGCGVICAISGGEDGGHFNCSRPDGALHHKQCLNLRPTIGAQFANATSNIKVQTTYPL